MAYSDATATASQCVLVYGIATAADYNSLRTIQPDGWPTWDKIARQECRCGEEAKPRIDVAVTYGDARLVSRGTRGLIRRIPVLFWG